MRVDIVRRLVLAAAALLAAAGMARAQDSLEERLQTKQKEPFLAKAAWVLDFEQAKAESRKSGKPIFAYFTRSYAN